NEADTDGDGIDDGDEVDNGTDPLVADTDGDGVDDGDEVDNGTDPLVADTDGDGVADGVELDEGTDPLDADDTPRSSGAAVEDGCGCTASGAPTASDVGWVAGLFLLMVGVRARRWRRHR
ncbi:MAG: thrombospondin type 3 repeat-containing protein, partial [Persicimonas sp.]